MWIEYWWQEIDFFSPIQSWYNLSVKLNYFMFISFLVQRPSCAYYFSQSTYFKKITNSKHSILLIRKKKSAIMITTRGRERSRLRRKMKILGCWKLVFFSWVGVGKRFTIYDSSIFLHVCFFFLYTIFKRMLKMYL